MRAAGRFVQREVRPVAICLHRPWTAVRAALLAGVALAAICGPAYAQSPREPDPIQPQPTHVEAVTDRHDSREFRTANSEPPCLRVREAARPDTL